jgi:hypothetical protein
MQNAKCKMLASAIAGQWIFGIILALLGQLFGIPAATEHLHLDLPAQARLLLTLFTGQLLLPRRWAASSIESAAPACSARDRS